MMWFRNFLIFWTLVFTIFNQSLMAEENTIQNGLIAHYEFEGNANDSSGNENNGTEHGEISYVNGVLGLASSFNGLGSIKTPIELTKEEKNQYLTISFWGIAEDSEHGTFISNYNYGDGSHSIGFDVSQAGITGGFSGYHSKGYCYKYIKNSLLEKIDKEELNACDTIYNRKDIYDDGATPVDFRQWHYYSITYDNHNEKIFIDGIKVIEREMEANLIGGENGVENYLRDDSNYDRFLNIGTQNNAFHYPQDRLDNISLKGKIDDLRIYDRALTQSEIETLYILGGGIIPLQLMLDNPKEGSTQTTPFTKEWHFNKKLNDLTITIIDNSYQNNLSVVDLIKDGKTVRVNLIPNLSKTFNTLTLQFEDSNGDIVTIDGNNTFSVRTTTKEKDSDGDGISDKDEKKYGFNPLDASDATEDADGDGINNIDEINAGLNPTNKDTDGDGVNDKEDKYPLDSTLSVEITIQDEKLLACVQSTLQLTEGEIPTTKQLMGMKKLYCRNKNLLNDNIKEIHKMINLEKIYLDKNNITDIETVREMTKLTYLNLGNNSITNDIEIFSSLINLQYLYLDNNKVVGNLSSLSSLHQLKRLYLYNTKVVGDIEALSEMNNIEYIHLFNTIVSGNLSSLSEMKKLRYLNLYNSKITGDLRGVENLTNLEYIYLHNSRKLQGDLSSLSNLHKLKRLYLYNTKVVGEIDILSEMTNIEYLHLYNLKVSGNLSVLSEMRKLKYLNLSNSKITGDLSGLANSTKLEYIYLHNAKELHGDLSSLANLHKVKLLYLYNTQVIGDLEALSEMKNMETIHLYKTKVSGTLSNLSEMKNLTYLNLYNSEITGDLTGLENLTNLEYLYLHNSKKLHGDLSSLANLHKIVRLYLYNTKVVGDIEALSEMKNVEYLHLFNIKISGNLSSLSKMKKLRYLNFYNSDITGDLIGLENLTNLEYIYLNKARKLQGDLSSLTNLHKVIRLYLYSTKVSGDINALSEMKSAEYIRLSNTQVSGEKSSLDSLPKLKVLDVENTEVI